ncbi:hypothetical protein SUGI_0842670 [Cryptomeria japonica]|nr:hypothetical protein SUGI_0842670 [Cryptomeria japonica]
MQAPVNNDHPEQPFFTNQQLLDYYEQSLFQAFHQVEELKRITRSRRKMGWCVNCSSSSSSHSSLSTRRENDVFKKSHGRHSSKMVKLTPGGKGGMKEGPSTSDGLMLAVDKFLTGEFRG